MAVLLSFLLGGMACAAASETFNYDRFGTVTLYPSRGRTRDVAVVVSGSDGWDAQSTAIAARLADRDTLVAGIDLRHYQDQLDHAAEACVSPASDLENLSHYLQSKLGLKNYLPPTLVGVGAGANLVQAALAEGPDGLFRGAVSIGFCPGGRPGKALCKGPPGNAGRWTALQGTDDAECPVAGVRQFAANLPNSEVVSLPHVGHDYPAGTWMSQLDAAYAKDAAAPHEDRSSSLPAALADLPLVMVPSQGNGDWFGIFLTGDGGWVALDKAVAAELAKHDIPIVGWDSLKYFWSRRSPEGASKDLDRVMRHYAQAWRRSHVLLIGYSQGADTLPFMVNRLPAATHALIGFTTLLGISDNALFEFHVATWLGSPAKGIPTAPELARWSGAPYLCLYGDSDPDAACEQVTGHDGTVVKMSGGHHMNGEYHDVAEQILTRMPGF